MTEGKSISPILKNIALMIILVLLGAIFTFLIMERNYNKYEDISKKSVEDPQSKVLTIEEAAEYLKLSEAQVKGIIIAEKSLLQKNHGFSGVMFPYFIIDEEYYIDREQLDVWISDVSRDRREYNTKKFLMRK